MNDRDQIRALADRLANLQDGHKDDLEALKKDAEKAGVDFGGIRRLVAWRRKDATKRAEQEAIDEQYRFLAGERATPAQIPPGGELARAVETANLTVRKAADEMKVSVGKAQKLRKLAALFDVHVRVNVNTPDKPRRRPTAITPPEVAALPAHDPATGEIHESSGSTEGRACQAPGAPVVTAQNGEGEAIAMTQGDTLHGVPAGVEPGPLDTPLADRLLGRFPPGPAVDHAGIEADDLAIPEGLRPHLVRAGA